VSRLTDKIRGKARQGVKGGDDAPLSPDFAADCRRSEAHDGPLGGEPPVARGGDWGDMSWTKPQQ
jgi:hypothetical protein